MIIKLIIKFLKITIVILISVGGSGGGVGHDDNFN